MLEKEVHQILIDNIDMQRDLANILNINFDTMELVHEDQYINLMYADFTVYSNNKIRNWKNNLFFPVPYFLR